MVYNVIFWFFGIRIVGKDFILEGCRGRSNVFKGKLDFCYSKRKEKVENIGNVF